MAFPAFNPAQLLAASTAPSTPLKPEGSDIQADAIRYLAAGGPLFQGLPGGFPGNGGLPGPDAFRALAAQSGLPFPMMYPGMQPEFKPEMLSAGGGAIPGIFFDAMGYHPYAAGLDGSRRKNATRETTAPLKAWLSEHRKNPYPTKGEKVMLAVLTKMTLTQVSTWFANARRRLKKENKMTWSPRNRPGEDDDDDLADLDNLDTTERPSSSTSDMSSLEKKDGSLYIPVSGDESNNNAENEATGALNGKRSLGSPGDEPSPKKPKIWSIADLSASASATPVKDEHRYDHDTSSEAAGSSKKESPSSDEAVPQLPTNPFLAWQQQLLAMSRLGQMPFPMMAPRPNPGAMPTGMPAGFPLFNPMLLASLQQQAAAVAQQQAANSQLNGSWSEGQSLSPSSSNHSAAAVSEDTKPTISESA